MPTSRLIALRRRAVGRVRHRLVEPALAPERREATALADRVVGLESAVAAHDQRLTGLRDEAMRVREQEDRLRAELIGAMEGLRARLQALEQTIEGDRDALHGRLDRLDAERARARTRPYVADPALTTFDLAGTGRVFGFRQPVEARASDYVAFEDVFRGPEERVRERQRPYVDLLADRAPVLDAGCGRGEMLDLLAERGVPARGVDLDAGMVAHCRAKGHEQVQQGDLVEYLHAQPEGELGAIFSAQVIEHLPFGALERFLALARRALAPGGLLVAETVNPHADHALRAFWVDPTHQHPLFPEVTLTLCRIAGFHAGHVLHPVGSGDPERDRLESDAYAVVATAPG